MLRRPQFIIHRYFRLYRLGGSIQNTPPELLTMDTLDTSNTSKGDGSTAVNTPIDGPASNLETFKRVVGSTSDLKKNYSLGSVHSDTVSESEAPTKDQAGDRRPKSGSDIV